jgi:hypothetical protein
MNFINNLSYNQQKKTEHKLEKKEKAKTGKKNNYKQKELHNNTTI